MRIDNHDIGRFVQTAPVNRTDGFEECDGIIVFFGDADLRACGINPDSTDFVGVRITSEGRVILYEAIP